MAGQCCPSLKTNLIGKISLIILLGNNTVYLPLLQVLYYTTAYSSARWCLCSQQKGKWQLMGVPYWIRQTQIPTARKGGYLKDLMDGLKCCLCGTRIPKDVNEYLKQSVIIHLHSTASPLHLLVGFLRVHYSPKHL